MKLRIMVTGKNRKIAKDICEHLENDKQLTPIKCAPKKKALFETAVSEMPHVIIICAGNETKESVHAFDILKESANAEYTRILVIASEEDKKTFINETSLDRMLFLSRPVSLSILYHKLEELEEFFATQDKKDYLSVEEYINPLATDVIIRKHILIVDDDPASLAAIKEQLREFYEVTVVNSGRAAFRYLEKHRVDLILLDYKMPELDGPQVYEKLRMDPGYNVIPVVFLTAVSDKDLVIRTLTELKPEGYILKPSKKSELVAKIIDVLG